MSYSAGAYKEVNRLIGPSHENSSLINITIYITFLDSYPEHKYLVFYIGDLSVEILMLKAHICFHPQTRVFDILPEQIPESHQNLN